jgi:CHAT domain-containing protein/Tfp pilus assembly protein PilF
MLAACTRQQPAALFLRNAKILTVNEKQHFHAGFGFSQSPKRIPLSDTLLAKSYVSKAEGYFVKARYDSARLFFEKAANIYKRKKMWERYFEFCNKAGECLWRNNNDQETIDYLYKNVFFLKAQQNLGAEFDLKFSKSFLHIAIGHAKQNHHDSALVYFGKALMITSRILGEKHEDVARLYSNIANVYRRMKRHEKAIEYFDKALEVEKQLTPGSRNVGAANYRNLSILHSELYDYEKALEYAHAELDIAIKKNDQLVMADAYRNLGQIYRNAGDNGKAIEQMQEALKISYQLFGPNHPKVASALHSLGTAYRQKGDFDKALELYENALRIKIAHYGQNHQEVADSYNNIGNVYNEQQKPRQALECFFKALEIGLRLPNAKHDQVAVRQLNIGISYRELKEYDKAIEYLQKALEGFIPELGEKHHYVALNYHILNMVYNNKGDYLQGLAYAEKALAINLETLGENHPETTRSYGELAALKATLGDFEAALKYCQRALEILCPGYDGKNFYTNPNLDKVTSKPFLFWILATKAQTLQRRFARQSHKPEDLEMSLSTYALAAKLRDLQRQSFRADESKLFSAEDEWQYHREAVGVALQLFKLTGAAKYEDLAFDFAEKNKAAVLEGALRELQAKRLSGLPDSLLEKEAQLKSRLTLLDIRLQKEREKPDKRAATAADLENQKLGLQVQYDQLLNDFEKKHPAYFNLKYRTKTVSIAQIQNQLDQNTAWLQYFLSDSVLHIFAITKTKHHIASVPVDSSFFQNIEHYGAAIKTNKKETYQRAAFALYQKLIAPIKSAITEKNSLMIIPHANLHKLPFEALLTEMPQSRWLDFIWGDATGFRRLPYLVRKFNIAYHYSATLFVETQTASEIEQSNKSFVGFAPVFAADSEGNKIVDKSLLKSYLKSLGEIFRNGENFNELPYSADEVRKITGLLQNAGYKTNAFTYDAASEKNFKQFAGGHRFVHLATHSFANTQTPALSGIAFFQPQDSTVQEDGILYSGEIYNLKLNADLLVLSSCESGMGTLWRSEGLMGLTRGFLYAGVDNIVFSLWNVYDKYSSELMVAFYRNILAGQSYTQSLRHAKLQLLKNAESAAPVFWSGFLLLGQ